MIRIILTDIEGTTSPITFVKEVLFPYAARELPAFLMAHWQDEAVQEHVSTLPGSASTSPQSANALLQQWIQEDRKATPLKALQGMIWQTGYASGELRSPLYPDVLPALTRWRTAGLMLCVYSSGSIAAQKLLFGYTEQGDITSLFSGYFDTTSGPKQSVDSYRRICQSLDANPDEVLFLSDIAAELDAAATAGLATCQLDRQHDAPTSAHCRTDTFAAIDPAHFNINPMPEK